MHFLKTLFVSAAMATMAIAQSQQLAFTSTPASVTAGKPVTITYAGGDSSPATITLRKGDPNNLQTISVLTTSATGGSFTWTPDASLANGNDYALQITQGLKSINYSGQFAVSGGSASAQASASSTSSMSMSSASVSSAIASLNNTVSSIVASMNGTVIVVPTTTMGGTAVSAGTGTAMARNTTMSIATLTSTAGSTASATGSSGSGSGSGSSGASSGTGAGAAGSSSTSAPKSSNDATGFSSSLGLMLSVIAAVVYLN